MLYGKICVLGLELEEKWFVKLEGSVPILVVVGQQKCTHLPEVQERRHQKRVFT
jgi:hypothetical protein